MPGSFMPNINSITIKTKELLRYHCGYHGKIVTIATGHSGDAYFLNEDLRQIETHYFLEIIEVLL